MTTAETINPQDHKWGIASIVLGSAALLLAVIIIFGGPFAPQQSAGTSLGEIAGEMREAAQRKLQGLPQPEPQARPWTVDRVLQILAPALGVLAIVAAVVSAVQSNSRRMAAYGTALGVSAILVQFLWWVVLLVAGVVLLVSVMENFSSIIGE